MEKHKQSPLLSDYENCKLLNRCYIVLLFMKYYAQVNEKETVVLSHENFEQLIQGLEII